MKLQTIGAILLAGAVLAAIVMQFAGLGLVTSRAPTAAPQVIAGPPGSNIVKIQVGPSTVFHLKRITPLAGTAVLGLVCFLIPRRHETTA